MPVLAFLVIKGETEESKRSTRLFPGRRAMENTQQRNGRGNTELSVAGTPVFSHEVPYSVFHCSRITACVLEDSSLSVVILHYILSRYCGKSPHFGPTDVCDSLPSSVRI